MFCLMRSPYASATQRTRIPAAFPLPCYGRPTLALGQHGAMQHGGKVLVGRRAGAAVLDQVWQHVLLRRRACAFHPYTERQSRHTEHKRSGQLMRADQQVQSRHDSQPRHQHDSMHKICNRREGAHPAQRREWVAAALGPNP